MQSDKPLPWFVRGDVDGFFGLALDNLVQLLLIDTLCRTVLGFPDARLYGRVLPAFHMRLLGRLVAVGVGRLHAWIKGIAPHGGARAGSDHLQAPVPVFGDLITALDQGHTLTYLGVIVPMGLLNLVGSLQNIESAEASGDPYPTAPCLVVNGLGSIAASLFGSCFPTTIYICHPGWKAMGARSGYSVANATFFTAVALTGTLRIPPPARSVYPGLALIFLSGVGIILPAFRVDPQNAPPPPGLRV